MNTEDKAITKEERSTAVGSFGMTNMIGFTAEDLPMPYIKIIQKMTIEKGTADGGEAKEGQLYHTMTKTAKDSMDIIVLAAKKDRQLNTQETPPTEETVVKIFAIEAGSEQPFMLFLRKGNIGAWKRIFGELVYGEKNTTEVVLRIYTEEQTVTKEQKTFKFRSLKFENAGPVSDEQTAIVKKLFTKFDLSVFDRGTETVEVKEEVVVVESEEDVDSKDIPF